MKSVLAGKALYEEQRISATVPEHQSKPKISLAIEHPANIITHSRCHHGASLAREIHRTRRTTNPRPPANLISTNSLTPLYRARRTPPHLNRLGRVDTSIRSEPKSSTRSLGKQMFRHGTRSRGPRDRPHRLSHLFLRDQVFDAQPPHQHEL